jgi:hypothetical protein
MYICIVCIVITTLICVINSSRPSTYPVVHDDYAYDLTENDFTTNAQKAQRVQASTSSVMMTGAMRAVYGVSSPSSSDSQDSKDSKDSKDIKDSKDNEESPSLPTTVTERPSVGGDGNLAAALGIDLTEADSLDATMTQQL